MVRLRLTSNVSSGKPACATRRTRLGIASPFGHVRSTVEIGAAT